MTALDEKRVCDVFMRTSLCGREVYRDGPHCILHAADPDKDRQLFLLRMVAIEFGEEPDFTRVVFPVERTFNRVKFKMGRFYGAVFLKPVVFSSCAFEQWTSFTGAEFREALTIADCDFKWETYFEEAKFGGPVVITGSRFATHVTFKGSAFASSLLVRDVSFGPLPDDDPFGFAKVVLDFSNCQFDTPDKVTFRHINRGAAHGLRLRIAGTPAEKFDFEDVHWHRFHGRMVLQDELDLRAAMSTTHEPDSERRQEIQWAYGSWGALPADAHQTVVAACNRLVRNFEGRLDYDLAEDCFIGAMEVQRLDPATWPFGRVGKRIYARSSVLRRIGSYCSVRGLYKAVSRYGSSYRVAAVALTLLLALFGLVYAVAGEPHVKGTKNGSLPPTYRVANGLFASIEIASFQRDRMIELNDAMAPVRVLESIAVPAQVTILLLALRRRFKR